MSYRGFIVAAAALLVLTPASPAAAGAQQVWMHTYPGVGPCGLQAVSTAVDAANGTVYAAYHDFECGPDAGLLVAYSSTGTRRWAVENTSSDDQPVGVAVDPATHTVLMASTRNDAEMLLQAFDASGHKLWGKALLAGGTNNFDTVGVVVDAHSRVVVTGTVTSAGVPSFSTAAFKVATGAVMWHVHYMGGESLGATALGIAVDPGQNRAYIVGTAFTGEGEDLVTVAYGTGTGNIAWKNEVAVAPAADAVPTGIAVDTGNHQVYSLTGNTGNAEADTYAYASSGDFQWKRVYTGVGVLPHQIAVDSANHQVYVSASGGSQFRTTLIAYSAAGAQQWNDVDTAANQAFPEGLATDPSNHRVYVTSRAGPSTTSIVTFADSPGGARAWHEVVSANAGQSIESGALAVDASRSQVYVTGDESSASGVLYSVAIADGA